MVIRRRVYCGTNGFLFLEGETSVKFPCVLQFRGAWRKTKHSPPSSAPSRESKADSWVNGASGIEATGAKNDWPREVLPDVAPAP